MDGYGIAPLTAGQMRMAALAGAILWFAAAVLLMIIGPMGAYEGINRVILYVVTVPVSLSFVPIVRWMARLQRRQLGLGLAFATATATLLDGLALAWWPALYGGPDYVAGAGAVILWGAGVVMMLGFWMARGAGRP